MSISGEINPSLEKGQNLPDPSLQHKTDKNLVQPEHVLMGHHMGLLVFEASPKRV